jgi:hypothetical protein
VFEFFCQGYFRKSNVLTKSGFTITNWNPIVKKIKEEFCKTILVKALGKGETHLLSKNNDGQSNMTTTLPRQYPTSTLNHNRATTVPSEYSVRHLSPFFPRTPL